MHLPFRLDRRPLADAADAASGQGAPAGPLGELPEWNLDDLYPGPDAPALREDLDAAPLLQQVDLRMKRLYMPSLSEALCKEVKGERIYLALSGAGGIVIGSVEFVACHGPLSAAEYAKRASQHCVAGSTLPYGGKTYAWEVRAPERFAQPVRYPHRQGCVIWAKME